MGVAYLKLKDTMTSFWISEWTGLWTIHWENNQTHHNVSSIEQKKGLG